MMIVCTAKGKEWVDGYVGTNWAMSGYWHDIYYFACKWGDFITTGKTRAECIEKMIKEVFNETN